MYLIVIFKRKFVMHLFQQESYPRLIARKCPFQNMETNKGYVIVMIINSPPEQYRFQRCKRLLIT